MDFKQKLQKIGALQGHTCSWPLSKLQKLAQRIHLAKMLSRAEQAG